MHNLVQILSVKLVTFYVVKEINNHHERVTALVTLAPQRFKVNRFAKVEN